MFFFQCKLEDFMSLLRASYSSLASSSAELSQATVDASGRLMHFLQFSDFGGKMGFLGHNFGYRHARRSSKGSIVAGHYLVSQKITAKISAYWIGVQGPSKWVKKTKTPPLCEPVPGEPLTQIKKIFF